MESSEPAVAQPGKEEINWAALAHVLSLIGAVLPVVGNILPPLIIWLTKRDGMPFVEVEARESLNFQISVTIYALACSMLFLVGIGFVLVYILGVVWFILVIMAALKVNKGEAYRYPLNLRLIK
jgi:uncharacterized Tic20 family protein